MNERRTVLGSILLVALSVAASLAVAPELPARMASHWNAAGQVDGTMPKLWGMFLVPAMALGLLAVFAAIPRIDPLRENIERFRGYYHWMVLLLVGFLTYVHLLVLAANLGYDFSMTRALVPATGVLYYVLGAVLENAERNWFVGIRTPWTLSSDAVWRRTHDLGGRLFRLSGVLAVLGVLVPAYAIYLAVGPVLAFSLYLVLYSFVAYRRLDEDGEVDADASA